MAIQESRGARAWPLLRNRRGRWSQFKTVGLACLLLMTILMVLPERHKDNTINKEHIGQQRQIIKETEQFRNFEDICYAGYCGPWIEEYFMDLFFKKDVTFQRLYLPISWTNCHQKCSNIEKDRLRQYIQELDVSKQYFTVLQIDRGLHHYALEILFDDDLDLMIFCSGGITHGKKITNVPIPLLKERLSPEGVDEKKHLISFLGSITHPVREELEELYRDKYYFNKSDDWKRIIEQSTFSLCPRGFGATSFRLYEAIQLNSIPIYVWEEDLMLPFSDVLDWNSFSIILHRSEIESLPDKVMKIDQAKMQDHLDMVQTCFTYEYTSNYIFQKLQA